MLESKLFLYLLIFAVALVLPSTHRHADAYSLQDAPIKIGVFLDLSGQTANFGATAANGIRMAVDEINEAGGINDRKVALFVRDDEGHPDRAADVVRGLIHQDKVHALIGEVASSTTFAAASVAQEAKVPLIAPAATHPRVTAIGDYIFRACFIDPAQGEALAQFAFGSLKARKAAVFYDANSDYSKSLSKTFTNEFISLRGRIVIERAYAQTDSNFKAQLVAIRAAKPDVIFVPGYYGQAGLIAKQARQIGLTQPLLGADGWDSPQLWTLGGKALNGAYMSNHYSVDNPLPANQKFVADYNKRYGRFPDSLAALGYDAVMLLADAVRRAGAIDGEKLRDAIAQTDNLSGITGSISIDAARNAIKPILIFKLHDKKFMFHEAVSLNEPSAIMR